MNTGTILKFSGHSDDIVSVETITYTPRAGNDPIAKITHDEITAANEGPTKILVETIGGSQGCYVFAHYDGCWHFSVRQLDEDVRLPAWDFAIHHDIDHKYSVELVVDALKGRGELLAKPRRIDDD